MTCICVNCIYSFALTAAPTNFVFFYLFLARKVFAYQHIQHQISTVIHPSATYIPSGMLLQRRLSIKSYNATFPHDGGECSIRYITAVGFARDRSKPSGDTIVWAIYRVCAHTYMMQARQERAVAVYRHYKVPSVTRRQRDSSVRISQGGLRETSAR